MNEWVSVDDELPPEDGLYRITNDPLSDIGGIASYDGYGFEVDGIYRKPQFWQKYEFIKKKYANELSNN
jgi:hypothetical protein